LLGLADQAAVNLNKTRLYSQSITDRMTGLYNSRYFEQVFFDRLAESVANGKPLTIAISDIDHFKKFNDVHGHAAGDEVLKHVAKIFGSCARGNTEDIAFRYGGEEFCMLLPNTTPVEAMQLLEKYRAKVEGSPLNYLDKELKVTVSVGLATSLVDASDCKQLFERADETLYESKRSGRNQIRHHAGGTKLRYETDDLLGKLTAAFEQSQAAKQ
jgi:diguanylate cyclase (GGDEF)-like protein